MSILDAIKPSKEEDVANAKASRSLSELEQAIKQLPPPRDFVGAIAESVRNKEVALIAEIKKPVHPRDSFAAISMLPKLPRRTAMAVRLVCRS
ncbi:hypothetical protein ACKZDW_14470 [Ralstonia syzygii subsp. celebesensis]|uniref:hypothetical protein n=1 Tax=Ralstonia syzygii TaxID=28097 RepID=UPI00387E1054